MPANAQFQIRDVGGTAFGRRENADISEVILECVLKGVFARRNLARAQLSAQAEIPFFGDVLRLLKPFFFEALPEPPLSDARGGVPGTAVLSAVNLQTSVEHRMRCHVDFVPFEVAGVSNVSSSSGGLRVQ